MINHPLADDLNSIFDQTKPLWNSFKNKSIFVTGGTGFIGMWLLESLIWANDRLNLNVKVVVLTRNPIRFKENAPHLASHEAISLHKGDVMSFDFPKEDCHFIIHAAGETTLPE